MRSTSTSTKQTAKPYQDFVDVVVDDLNEQSDCCRQYEHSQRDGGHVPLEMKKEVFK